MTRVRSLPFRVCFLLALTIGFDANSDEGVKELGKDKKEPTYNAMWLKENVSGMKQVLPDEVEEISLDGKLTIHKDVKEENVGLGKMQAGKWHYCAIRFQNAFDETVRVTKIETTCGCLSAANSKKDIDARGEGIVIAVIKPQMRSSSYRKAITVTFSNGFEWTVNLSGEFEANFELEKSRIAIQNGVGEIELKLVAKEKDRPFDDVFVVSATDHLIIKSQLHMDDGIVLKCRVPVDIQNSNNSLSEVLAIKSRKTEAVICEAELLLEARNILVCKPNRVLLKKIEGQSEFTGVAYLLGRVDGIALQAKETLQIETGEEGSISGSAVIEKYSRSSSRVSIRFTNLPDRQEVLHNVKIVQDGKIICEIPELEFSVE